MRVTKLKFSFDDPDAGWIAIELSVGERRCSFPVEHVPYDLIQQLADGLGNLLSGSPKISARANDGPIEYEFIFEKTGDQIDLRVYVLNETPFGKDREELFGATDSVYAIIRPFWKALRDLETKYLPDEYLRRWREAFPEREMRYFTEQFEKVKKLQA